MTRTRPSGVGSPDPGRQMSPGGGRRPGAPIPWWMVGVAIGVLLVVGALAIQLAGGGW